MNSNDESYNPLIPSFLRGTRFVVAAIQILVASTLLIGCASRGEIQTMKNQLNFLERSSSQMQERLLQMDSLYRETIDKNVTYQADLKVALAELIDKSNAIDGRLTDMERRLNSIADKMGTPQRSVQQATPADTLNSATTGLPTVDPNKLFDNAFADLRSKNQDLAIIEFGEFLNQFPDNPQADDAQYWLGECYFGKQEYTKAIPEFEKVEKNYPQSDRLTAALYKLGRSYQETGNPTKARAIYDRIIKDFATSFEAKQAQERLKEL